MAATILTQNDLIKVINSSTATVDILFKSITHIINSCNSITPGMILRSTMILKSLPLMLRHMQVTMTEFINSLGEDYFNQKIQKNILTNIKTIGDIYNNVFDLIQKIIGTNFIKLIISFKMLKLSGPTVLKGLEAFSKIVDKITQTVSSIKSDNLTGAEKSLRAIKSIINNIAIIIASLLLLLPLITLFILASPIIILCLWLFGLVIKIITNIIIKAVNVKTIVGLVLLTSVIGIIMLIALMLVAMAYIANDMGKIILNTLKLLLGIVAVALAVVLLGWLLGTGFKFLLIAMGGLLLLATLIGIVFIVAVMLYILQFVRFDKEKVKAAVENIMECVAAIIEALFYGFSSVGGGKKSDPWYMQVLTFAGGTIKTLITAIMSIRSLALMVISIILIRFLGVLLKGLQYLDLDKEKVKANVANILECVFAVIDALFNGMGGIDEKDAKNKPWYQTVLSFMGGIIKTLIVPMMALSFLPQVLVSIGLLQILARQLKDIQNLNDINSKVIQANIKDIMAAAMSVMMSILFPTGIPTQKDTKGKSWFKVVLEYMAGPVALLIGPILALQIFGQLIISIGLLQLLARQLADLQTLHVDKDLIAKNVGDVMGSASSVMMSILFPAGIPNQKDTKGKSWFKAVLEYMAGPVALLIGPIMAILTFGQLIISIGLLQLLARQIKDLQTLTLDRALIKDNISNIMDIAFHVLDSIWNMAPDNKNEGGSSSWFGSILEYMGGVVYQLITPILAIGYFAKMIIVIGLLHLLADQLNTIQNIKLDNAAITNIVNTIFNTVKHITSNVFQPVKTKVKQEKDKGGFLSAAIDFVKEIAGDTWKKLASVKNIVDLLLTIGELAIAFIAINMIHALANNLKTIQDISLNTATVTRKVSDIASAAVTVANSMNPIGGLSINGNSIYKLQSILALADQISKSSSVINVTKDQIKTLLVAASYYQVASKVVKELVTINAYVTNAANRNLSYDDFKNIIHCPATIMINLLNDIGGKIKTSISTVDSRMSQLVTLFKIIKLYSSLDATAVNNSEAITKNYISLLDKIGTTDIEKLKTTVNLFEKMAEFSKSINGNFEGLADALNEKIAPLLEKIQNGMDGLKSSVEQSSADVSSSVYAASQGTLSNEEMKKQVGRENPQASEKDKNDMVMKRMQQQIIKQNNELSSNIDELISLFRNGNARVTIRH